MKTALLLASLSLVSQLAHADPYIGVGLSVSKQTVNLGVGRASKFGSTYDVSDVQQNVLPTLGYQWDHAAIEIGGGGLGLRTAHNVQLGEFDITQDIATHYAFAQGVFSLDVTPRLSLHLDAGIARVWMKNHEYGCNPCDAFVDHVNYSVADRPIVGLGLQYAWSDRIALRADVEEIRDIAESLWTRSSDVTVATAALLVRF